MTATNPALVTGSTNGIGLGIARAYAKGGANVVLNGFGEVKKIKETRAGIERAFSTVCHYSGADNDGRRGCSRDDGGRHSRRQGRRAVRLAV